jgi:nucleoprotein TPR
MADVDTSYLSATLGVPESNIQSLLDAPTVDLVQGLLQALITFAKSHEELKAEKLRSDVELETAIRSGSARTRQLKESLEKSLKETESLRRSVNESGRTEIITYFPIPLLTLYRKCTRHSRQ